MDGRETVPDPEEGEPMPRPEPTCRAVDAITRHRLGLLGLAADDLRRLDPTTRRETVYARFIERIPYETLSNHRACCEHPDQPSAWPRATDRLLRDNHSCGLGGTSFTLAYALRDLLRGVGANAHCTLGRNLVTEQTHAAVVVYDEDGAWLYDPALLAVGPLAVRPGGLLEDPLGTLRFEPERGPTLTVTLTPAGTGKARPLYAIIPLPTPPQRYRQAWVASFCKGRRPPLVLARRIGDEIRRYSDGPHRLEILTARGRVHRRLVPRPVEELRDLFGIDEGCLRTWYEGS